MGNCVKSPLRNLSKKIRHEEKTSYKAVQTSEEGPSAGEYQGPLMVLAQNCAVMHNLLGPACIFLRKGFAENRQPVRKLPPAGRDAHGAADPAMRRRRRPRPRA
uniref:Uncharacterized protein n=1 Tax=Nothoprocta perdicaria TaxID=30464 RepID=A0A8C6Z6S4_NOTPE